MNTKRAIQHLKKNGFTVDILYTRRRLCGKYETFNKPIQIKGKFQDGGKVVCIVKKMFNTHTQLYDIVIPKKVTGRAICMKIDLYIPRVGRAIAFENAVKHFPEAKKCLEDANLYSEYVKNKEKENDSKN
jgi:hypothetical protein